MGTSRKMRTQSGALDVRWTGEPRSSFVEHEHDGRSDGWITRVPSVQELVQISRSEFRSAASVGRSYSCIQLEVSGLRSSRKASSDTRGIARSGRY